MNVESRFILLWKVSMILNYFHFLVSIQQNMSRNVQLNNSDLWSYANRVNNNYKNSTKYLSFFQNDPKYLNNLSNLELTKLFFKVTLFDKYQSENKYYIDTRFVDDHSRQYNLYESDRCLLYTIKIQTWVRNIPGAKQLNCRSRQLKMCAYIYFFLYITPPCGQFINKTLEMSNYAK